MVAGKPEMLEGSAVRAQLVSRHRLRCEALLAEQLAYELDGCALIPSALNKDFENLALIIDRRHRYICLPAIRTTISSRCQLLLGRGRPHRSLRAIIGPTFSTHLHTVSYETSSPRRREAPPHRGSSG